MPDKYEPISDLAKAFLADQDIAAKPVYPTPVPVVKDPEEPPPPKDENKAEGEKPAQEAEKAKPQELPKEEPKAKEKEGEEKPKEEEKPKAEAPPKEEKETIKVESPKDSEEKPWTKDIRDLTEELRSSRTQPPPPATAPAQPPAEQFTPEEQRRLAVFQHMESTNPTHKGLVNKVKTYMQELRNYRAKWESEHPDETFDPESDEHTPFMDRHLPKYDEDEYDDARVDLRAQRVIEEREKKQAVETARKTLPDRINAASRDAIQEMVSAASPELAEVYAKNDLKAMEEKDPELTERLDAVVPELRRWVSELEKIFDPKLNYTPVPGNALHEEIEEFVTHAERLVQGLPSHQRVQNGKQFATLEQFYGMPESKRAGFWCLDAKQIEVMKARQLASYAKQRAEKARQRTASGKTSVAKVTPEPKDEKTPETKSGEAKPSAPGSASDAGLLNPGGSSGSSAKSFGRLVVDSFD